MSKNLREGRLASVARLPKDANTYPDPMAPASDVAPIRRRSKTTEQTVIISIRVEKSLQQRLDAALQKEGYGAKKRLLARGLELALREGGY